MKRFRVQALAVVWSFILVCGGCEKQPPPVQVQHQELSDVNIDNGAVLVTHNFELVNDSARPLEVVEVALTCGCVSAELSAGATISAFGRIDVPLGLHVTEAGTLRHGAAVLLSDGTMHRFMMSVNGVRSESLVVVPIPSAEDIERRCLTFQVVYTSFTNGDVGERIEILPARPGIAMAQGQWRTLESRSVEAKRPTRQVVDLALDFSAYVGSFPVKLECRLPSGPMAVIVVGEDLRVQEG